jgi:hypothetical protein
MAIAMFYVYSERVLGEDYNYPVWNRSLQVADTVGKDLTKIGVDENELVMINNPPGLYAATRRPSIVIPNGNEQDILELSREFGVSYLILEINHPPELAKLYEKPELASNLELIFSNSDRHYFRIHGEQ